MRRPTRTWAHMTRNSFGSLPSAVTHRTTQAHLYVTVVLPVLIDGATDDAAPDGSFWSRETFSATAIAQLLFLLLLLLLVQQCYIDSVYC